MIFKGSTAIPGMTHRLKHMVNRKRSRFIWGSLLLFHFFKPMAIPHRQSGITNVAFIRFIPQAHVKDRPARGFNPAAMFAEGTLADGRIRLAGVFHIGSVIDLLNAFASMSGWVVKQFDYHFPILNVFRFPDLSFGPLTAATSL